MTKHTWLVSLGILWFLVGCRPQPTPAAPPATATPAPALAATATPMPAATVAPAATPAVPGMSWWNDRVFYEVFVRSFQDSNGDGIGDLQGLISRLDYLNDGDPATTGDLGVTGIWLMPIFASPSYHGYDVTDYMTINPEYGTLDDFKQLLAEAHKRGIAVILDLPLNHTSNQHPWFQASAAGDPTYADWYVWTKEPTFTSGPWGEQVWYKLGDRYYYGVFWEGMPDLNLRNPEVTAALQDVARYWIKDVGVDGFRLDGVRHLVEEGAVQENTPSTHAWLRDFHTFYKSLDPHAFTVGEAWTTSDEASQYVGDQADIAFEFDLAQGMVNAVREQSSGPVAIPQSLVNKDYPPGQYGAFLTNHDQNRVMDQVGNDVGAAKVAATLLLTNPGVPFIYYGEEIGMEGQKPDEDIRRPMPWDASATAGFTTGQPWRPLGPGHDKANVVSEGLDPASLLNHYRALVQLRNQHPALRTGEMLKVTSQPSPVYAFLRHAPDETLLVLTNLGDKAVDDYGLTLAQGPLAGTPAAGLVFGEGQVTPPAVNAAGGFDNYRPLPSLPPRSSYVIRLGPENVSQTAPSLARR